MEELQKKTGEPTGNSFRASEWAGAFGDLGTLIPFVVGYITVVKMDPLGILFSFGILLIACGMIYKTPIPVQPMKAIGGAAITQAAAITPGVIWGAGLFTGIFWLVLGKTRALNFVSRIISQPVIKGIVLGLGISFILEGIKLMKGDLLFSAAALLITLLLLSSRRIPAMFALLIFGIVIALITQPGLLTKLSAVRPDFRLPVFALSQLNWSDFIKGMFVLGIPQIPLTLGNAVVAVTAENNRLFPQYPVSEKGIAVSQGIMNLISPIFGGVPVCHGAGGLAGHVRFGARTGGALIILGGLLLTLALFFSSSVQLLFAVIPHSVLGVILFFAGLELAVTARNIDQKSDSYVMLITAGFALWNMGIGLLAGLAIQELTRRKWVSF